MSKQLPAPPTSEYRQMVFAGLALSKWIYVNLKEIGKGEQKETKEFIFKSVGMDGTVKESVIATAYFDGRIILEPAAKILLQDFLQAAHLTLHDKFRASDAISKGIREYSDK